MISRFILAPLVFISLILMYFIWEEKIHAFYVIPFVILATAVYVLAPQIDWWWAKRKPLPVDPSQEKFLNKFFPYYRQLDISQKKRFMQRVSLYIMATDFTPMAMPSVPEDIKGLIAANIVMLTFGQDDFQLTPYEKVILYAHPFPSPQYREYFHSTEHFEEDGVILFSLEQLVPGATQPKQYYNIALHEYIRIFIKKYNQHKYPKLDDDIWVKLEAVSGFKTTAVRDFIGLPILEPLPVSINYFFTYPMKFKQVLPELYDQYQRIFNQNLIKASVPVVDISTISDQKNYLT